MIIALPVSVFVLIVVLCLLLERRRRVAFQERFPPISDDEFVSLCPPGTSREIALKVRRIMASQLDVEYERIYPSSRIYGDLITD
jgi:hypothetical protein